MSNNNLIEYVENIALTKKDIDFIYETTKKIILNMEKGYNNDEEISCLYYKLNNLYNRKHINQRFLDGISFLISSVYLFYAGKRKMDKEYFERMNKVFYSFKDDMNIYQQVNPHNILSIITEYELN
jgi:hypothetical protein